MSDFNGLNPFLIRSAFYTLLAPFPPGRLVES